MTSPLPANAAESRHAGARSAGLLPRLFAVSITFHGLVHVIGFTTLWRLGGPRGVEYSTRLFNRSVEVGDTAVKLVGLVWLGAAVALVLAGVMLWRGHPAARRSTVALLVVSSVLCLTGLPGSVMGLAVDGAALGLLAVVPDRLIASTGPRGEARPSPHTPLATR